MSAVSAHAWSRLQPVGVFKHVTLTAQEGAPSLAVVKTRTTEIDGWLLERFARPSAPNVAKQFDCEKLLRAFFTFLN